MRFKCMCIVFHVCNNEFLTLSDDLIGDIETSLEEFSRAAAACGGRARLHFHCEKKKDKGKKMEKQSKNLAHCRIWNELYSTLQCISFKQRTLRLH